MMSPEQKAILSKALSVRAEIAGRDLSPEAIIQMVEDLADLEYEDVATAILHWGKTNRGFPHPADLRERIQPEINSDDSGRETAALIGKAVARRGINWNQGVFRDGKRTYDGGDGKVFPTWEEAALEEMGELALEVVKRFGGWTTVAQFCCAVEPGTFQAQIREFTKLVAKKAVRGELDEKPALPSATSEVRGVINQSIRRLT